MARELKKIFVELASSNIKRQYGLMNRRFLSKNNGMLFKFDKASNLNFWMKDTYIPLDIAFIDNFGRITQIESMSPLSTKRVTSRDKCRYAIEMNKNWFKENNVSVGHKIKVSDFVKKHGIVLQSQSNNLNINTEDSNLSEVNVDMDHKSRIEDANNKNVSLVIIYQTESGNVLPPKKISPPFKLEKDKDGKMNSIVKAWDNQDASWKSFLIDNIIGIEDAE